LQIYNIDVGGPTAWHASVATPRNPLWNSVTFDFSAGGATMDWKALFFSFHGRVGRRRYWLALVACNVAAFAISFVVGFLARVASGSDGALVPLVQGPINLAGAYVSAAITAKRLHDHGRSGWWALAIALMGGVIYRASQGLLPNTAPYATVFGPWFLPYLGFFILLGFLPGQKSSNRFGPPEDIRENPAEVFS
jgi:uncharacterized membrane protein YhaH (DUF805 family)